MSSVNTVITDALYSDERGVNDLAAELTLEICSHLEVRDQIAVRRVCKRWRSDLCEALLSRYVDINASKVPNQAKYHGQQPSQQFYQYLAVSEKRLEQALNLHIQKNTKVFVLRHVNFDGNKFGIVARIIHQKQAHLIQLILQDCEVDEELAAAAGCWLNPQRITDRMMTGLIFVTRKLILSSYTISDALGAVSSRVGGAMPGTVSLMQQLLVDESNPSKKLPIVLSRHEFDCSRPLHEHYHSFIMALDSSCPEVSPEVREAVVQLYDSWIHNDAIQVHQWLTLGTVVKWLNEGVPMTWGQLQVNALRHLDPQTFNKLTMEVLHRMYCRF